MNPLLEKLNKSLVRTLSKGAIKAHARAIPQAIELTSEMIDVSVDSDVLTLTSGKHSVSLSLTKHWKSGSLYAHWIRLNKALIKLNDLVLNDVPKLTPTGKAALERLFANGKLKLNQKGKAATYPTKRNK
ncbi:hypothetical protein [Vibrio vulnificus]|uniref:hypothetical protein n=1 Tax=Vibrio vulnificus TaxID=672 RepID=UPI001594BBA9|nr:hypothetical protein [Vibrio vulnificus]NVC72622.1 hypothetical protein [Vibrio vulnificus]